MRIIRVSHHFANNIGLQMVYSDLAVQIVDGKSILSYTLSLPLGDQRKIYIGGSVTDLPGDYCKYSEAMVCKLNNTFAQIVIHPRNSGPIACTNTFNGSVWDGWRSGLSNADMREYICTQTAGTANYTFSILPIIFGRVVVIRLNNVVCKAPATALTLVSDNAPATNRGVSAVLCDSTGSGDTMRAIYGTEGQISLIGGTAGKTYFGEIITISQLDI